MSSRFHALMKASAAAIGVMALAGCATNPQEAITIAKPKTLPARNLTNFSESLRCMDRLFLQFDRSGMVITSAGIPDETAAISAGTKDMLISAISRMSRKSDAFSFVDYDSTQVDVHELQGLAGFDEDFEIPDFYIRGAITQLDDGVIDETVSASLGYDANFGLGEDSEQLDRSGVVSYGASADANQNVAVVSLDLNVGDLTTRQIISGISAHNSIAVSSRSAGGGLGGQISKFGASFAIAMNQNEGLHQAVRTLIELSTIEVLGKLAEVPFWRCLEIDHTNPAVVAEAREWFEAMDEEGQIAFVQQALSENGGYGGSVNSQLDATTKDAIARYQAQNDLIADGRINFDLYASLLNDVPSSGTNVAARPAAIRNVAAAEVEMQHDEEDYDEELYDEDDVEVEDDEIDDADDEVEETKAVVAVEALPLPVSPLALDIWALDAADGTFQLNRKLHFSASTSMDAHVYCYYADASGNVARIFPNQFQPDSFLPAGQALKVPGDEAGFDIILDKVGSDEQVACIASINEIGLRLPEAIKMPDLTPIPDQSLDDIVEAYRDLDSEQTKEARLDLKVIP